MNFSDYTPEQLPFNAIAPDEPLRRRLDLVTDCADLQGQFPQNVELKFVFWAHGHADDGIEIAHKAERLAPHVMQADRIGLEVAISTIGDKYEIKKLYREMNRYLMYHDHFAQEDSKNSPFDSNNGMLVKELSAALIRANNSNPPYFFPFDEMRFVQNPYFFQPYRGTMAEAYQNAQYMKRRESIALHQIQSQAVQLGRDGQPHQMAIIYGAQHSLVSVAARELGAKVTRVFLDKPIKTVDSILSREMRFNDNSDDYHDTVEKIESAKSIAFTLIDAAHRIGYKERVNALEVPDYSKLGSLVLRYYNDTISPREIAEYDKLVQELSSLTSREHITKSDKKHARKVYKKLLALADSVFKQ